MHITVRHEPLQEHQWRNADGKGCPSLDVLATARYDGTGAAGPRRSAALTSTSQPTSVVERPAYHMALLPELARANVHRFCLATTCVEE